MKGGAGWRQGDYGRFMKYPWVTMRESVCAFWPFVRVDSNKIVVAWFNLSRRHSFSNEPTEFEQLNFNPTKLLTKFGRGYCLGSPRSLHELQYIVQPFLASVVILTKAIDLRTQVGIGRDSVYDRRVNRRLDGCKRYLHGRRCLRAMVSQIVSSDVQILTLGMTLRIDGKKTLECSEESDFCLETTLLGTTLLRKGSSEGRSGRGSRRTLGALGVVDCTRVISYSVQPFLNNPNLVGGSTSWMELVTSGCVKISFGSI